MLLMHNKQDKLLTSTRWSISYIVLIPFLVAVFMLWNASQRINEFEQAHNQVAKSTTTIVANEISLRLKNTRQLLNNFAKNEEQLIHQLALSPNDETLKSKLDKKVADSFPDYFAVSIADRDGVPVIDDFDGLVGELCFDDLVKAAQGEPQPIRIHPNLHAYHIDIVAPWSYTEGNKPSYTNGGLLFVSFKTDFLFRLLQISSTPRHELMLINKNINNLIEITEKGNRVNLKRDDYRLTKAEQQRQLHSTAVKDTAWNLVDFREETLFSEYKKNIITFNALIFIFFILASALMVVLLLRAERRRISAEKSKEEMFSLFNHDLRAPLNSIYGFLEMYTATDLCIKSPEKCKDLASNAFDNTLIMREIVDDILDVQQMEAGEMSYYFTEIEIVSIIKDTVEMSAPNALINKVKFEILSDDDMIYIKADGRRIQQVLTNLLSNAIKYSPENETVTISIKRKNSKVIISVSDNGPGIEKEFQALAFNKFAQSKSKLTRLVGGTGLGLTVVKHIIDAHNGFVSLVSDADKGTTFKVTLPC